MSSASKGLQPNPDLIEYLEEKLALAKEGKIVAMSNIFLEKRDYDSPVIPRPSLFISSVDDLATIKMTYDVALLDELSYMWSAGMGMLGEDDE
jgi:hypothetical protein